MSAGPREPDVSARLLATNLAPTLLCAVEDAGLNASAPPQQLWMDGWIVRTSPGKAKRARCINAVARGTRPLDEQLAACAAVYAEAGLPMVVRLTPFTQPPGLDGHLAALGWPAFDDTRVMVLEGLDRWAQSATWQVPNGLSEAVEGPGGYAAAVGALRGSSAGEIQAHAARLAASPVPYTGVVWRDAGGAVAACGQLAREGAMVGLYDVFTAPSQRGRGRATALCAGLLARAAAQGARTAYLQVEAGNAPARAVYRRLGFTDAYSYHYRAPGGEAAGT